MRAVYALAITTGLVSCLISPGQAQVPVVAQTARPCVDRLGEAPLGSWTSTELWVWKQLCARKSADLADEFDSALDEGIRNDVAKQERWSRSRVVSHYFIEAILADGTLQEELGERGASINGVIVSGRLNLYGVKFRRAISITNAVFTSDVDLRGAVFKENFALQASTMDGRLLLDGATADGKLEFNRTHAARGFSFDGVRASRSIWLEHIRVPELRIIASRVDGYVLLSGASIDRILSIDGTTVQGSIFMNRIQLNRELRGIVRIFHSKISGSIEAGASEGFGIFLERVDIGGNLSFSDGKHVVVQMKEVDVSGQASGVASQIDLSLWIQDSKFGRSLYLRGAQEQQQVTKIANITIANVIVGGQLNLRDTSVEGGVRIESSSVGQSVLIFGLEAKQGVELFGVKVGENLEMYRGSFGSVYLTGSTIGGELALARETRAGSLSASWKPNAVLGLRNARAGSIRDVAGAWPSTLQLSGFQYDLKGGDDKGGEFDISLRSEKWFKEWLARSPFSPQPYVHLAEQFAKLGFKDFAENIQFMGFERERSERLIGSTWFWASLKLVFIGYGFRIYYALFWIFGLTLCGALVLHFSRSLADRSYSVLTQADMPRRLWRWELFLWRDMYYSFDNLLPIIRLNERHYDKSIVFSRTVEAYFMFHKLMGFVLASFLVAGLSGLTKA